MFWKAKFLIWADLGGSEYGTGSTTQVWWVMLKISVVYKKHVQLHNNILFCTLNLILYCWLHSIGAQLSEIIRPQLKLDFLFLTESKQRSCLFEPRYDLYFTRNHTKIQAQCPVHSLSDNKNHFFYRNVKEETNQSHESKFY